ncbi:putative high-affinity methionine permease [Triangularia verruculosa]|uniref:High-affinity methionine permease n=1 Tax=Triangularia verruculosa TaxID=2587418 RepID=A0AAN6XEH7_9PEZI|nr:putative high-affinity methionine permease [Triangularia verruculosa]
MVVNRHAQRSKPIFFLRTAYYATYTIRYIDVSMPDSIAMRDVGPARPLAADVDPLDAQASFPDALRRARNHIDVGNRLSATEPLEGSQSGAESDPPGETRHGSQDETHGDDDNDDDDEDNERRRRAAGPFKNPRVNTETSFPEESGTGPLGVFDIIALIANKMIGTGIYTAPASVFLLTGSKQLTLGLFGVGFFYSLISTFLYLDFAAAFPYTGGELVYISEMTAYSGIRESPPPIQEPFANGQTAEGGTPLEPNAPNLPRWHKTKRIFGDGLLAYVAYSILFIAFFNSGTNSMQTGRLILLCVNAGAVDENGMTPDVNRDLVRFVGIVVLSVICLLQYFSPSAGRSLNRAFAVIKILTLIALIGVAGNTARVRGQDNDAHAAEWQEKNPVTSNLSFAKAILAVLFSFEGWENATFVAGEVPRHQHRVLQKGFIIAVIVVGILYLAVVSAVLDALNWAQLNQERTNVNYAPLLTGNGTAARRGWAIMSAISSIGSLNSIIYTFSRVKQAIGQADILPWSKVWKKDDSMDRARDVSEQETRNPTNPQHYIHKSPQGGLVIHWTMSVVVIAGSSATANTIESIGIPGYIQTYVHVFILFVLALVSFRLPGRERALATLSQQPIRSLVRPSKLTNLCAKFIWYLLWLLYIAMNLTILGVNPVPPYSGSDGSNVSFPGWAFPAILFSILAFAILYYLVIFCPLPREYRPSQALGATPGEVPAWWARNPLHAAGIRAKFEFDKDYNEGLPRVFRFGRRWRVIYSVEGDRDGEEYDASRSKLFLYWLFGGDRLKETPTHKFWEWLKERAHFW